MATAPQETARMRLGQSIEFYMREAQVDDHRVSRTCSASAKDVERWRKGELVPSPEQWSKLKRSVNHTLGRFAELYQRARTEAENEARERAVINMNKERPPMRADTKINTSLADKLGTVTIEKPAPTLRVVESPPEPPRSDKTLASTDLGQDVRGTAADGRKLAPLRPAGAGASSQIERRRNFVRDLLRRAPNKRTSGADSVIEHVRKTFGIGISPDAVEEIRDELNRERIKAEIMAELPAPQPPTLPAMAAQIIEHIAAPTAPAVEASVEPKPGDLEGAVQLILEALPGLQTFTLSVDEHGEASVDYQIRKVKIETVGGSIKVRR